MKVRNILKIKIKGFNILTSILALFLILNCQSVYQRASDYNFHIYEACFILTIIYSCYSFLHWGLTNNKIGYVFLVSFIYYFLIFLVLLCSVDFDNYAGYLSRFLVFPFYLIFFATNAPQKKKFLIFKSFVNWSSLIGWITFICWVLSTIGILKPSGFFKVNWGEEVNYSNYYGIYFSSPYQYIDWFGGIKRNIGIFTEGPMFMLVLTFALLFTMLIEREYKFKRKAILGIILALLSTASITGYIVLILFIGKKIIDRHSNYRNKIITTMFGVIIAIVAVSWLFEMKSNTASFLIRIDDYLTGLKVWELSPLIGSGYENLMILQQYMSSFRSSNVGYSNTFFSVLAYGGIVFAIPYIAPVVRGVNKASKFKDMNLIIFCCIYFGMYFAVISYTFFVNFLIWGYLMTVHKRNYK